MFECLNDLANYAMLMCVTDEKYNEIGYKMDIIHISNDIY